MQLKEQVNKAKRVVGKVPGLGDMKTKADAEANIGKVANDVWKDYLQFKQTDEMRYRSNRMVPNKVWYGC